MQEIMRTVRTISPTDLHVVIIGEQGTGKERLARQIHELSTRSGGPLITVDCAAMTPEQLEQELFGVEALSWQGVALKTGALEEASNGTLLLDEFQSIPDQLQMKVARALEYKSVVRTGGDRIVQIQPRIIAIITRTSGYPRGQDPFRVEIQNRLSPIVIELPPLRERREDIPSLVRNFMAEARSERNVAVNAISDEALTCCLEYAWPGNVRHLKNAIEYACVMSGGGKIFPSHLPDYVAKVTAKY